MKSSLKRKIAEIAVVIAIALVLFFGSRIIKRYVSDNDGGKATAEQLVEGITTAEALTESGKSPEQDTEAYTQTEQQLLYNFRRGEYLTEHFEKHGGEFGYKTEQEYLEGANSVITDKDSLCKTEAEDGDLVFFQESTGSIVFVSGDGYIRTYFKPADGIDYFNRQ